MRVVSLLEASVGRRPRPWAVQPELVAPPFRALWPHLVSAIPCWEGAARPRDVVADRLPTWAAPAWGGFIVQPPNHYGGVVLNATTTGPTFANDPAYHRPSRAVTVMTLLYRPSSITTGNFNSLYLKQKAPTDFVSWGLLQTGTTDRRYLFGISTTTAVNQVGNLSGQHAADTWVWVVGRWTTGGEVNVDVYSSSGVLLQSTNPGPPVVGGTLIYDTSPMFFGGYSAYYAAAYVFSQRLADPVLRSIMRDPWGLVRPTSSAVGLLGSTGGGPTGIRRRFAAVIG